MFNFKIGDIKDYLQTPGGPDDNVPAVDNELTNHEIQLFWNKACIQKTESFGIELMKADELR